MKSGTMKYLTMIMFSVLVFSCKKDSTINALVFSLEQPSLVDEEDYEIYSLVANKYDASKIVIGQKSNNARSFEYHQQDYDQLAINNSNMDTNLAMIHNNVNQTSIFFGNFFLSSSKQMVLISEAEFNYLFNGLGSSTDLEEEFNKNYKGANGITRFTRIGYNSDKTQAIIEVSFTYSSGIIGSEEIIYLEKENGTWKIKDNVSHVWIV